MTKSNVTFYYSRHKVGLYLLLNFGLLSLAVLFTWVIFPDYAPVYIYALTACAISLLSALIVFVFPMPLAVIDNKQIKIDHNNPLLWSQIKKLEKQNYKCFGVTRSILKIIPINLPDYKKSFMQRITDSSRFGMFSIPLYAMDEKSAKEITKLIKEHFQQNENKTAAKSPKKTKVKATVKTKSTTVKKTKTIAVKKKNPKKTPRKLKKQPA